MLANQRAKKRICVLWVSSRPQAPVAIRGLTEGHSRIELLERRGSIGELVERLHQEPRPDFVLIDGELLDPCGVAAIQDLKRGSSAPVVAVAAEEDHVAYRLAAGLANVDACLLGRKLVDELRLMITSLWACRRGGATDSWRRARRWVSVASQVSGPRLPGQV